MVEYEVTIEEEKQFITNLFFYQTKKLLLPFNIMLVLGVLMFVLGRTVLPEFMYLGIFLLGSYIFVSLLLLLTGVLTVKNYVKSVSMFCEDGKWKCSVERADDKFVITNQTKNNVTTLGNEDIISAAVFRNVLIVNLKSKQSLLMPNKSELCEMFSGYFGKKN